MTYYDQPVEFRTGYLDDAIDNLGAVIDHAARALEGVKFDTLVGTGFSGGLVVPALAQRLGVNFLLVRKPGDNSHHTGRLVGKLGHRWIFVDDFVSSGETRARVQKAVSQANVSTTYVGDYLYVKGLDGFEPACRHPRESLQYTQAGAPGIGHRIVCGLCGYELENTIRVGDIADFI